MFKYFLCIKIEYAYIVYILLVILIIMESENKQTNMQTNTDITNTQLPTNSFIDLSRRKIKLNINHTPTHDFTSSLQKLYAYVFNESKDKDINIICSDGVLCANKMMLNQCKYFSTKFLIGMTDSNVKEIGEFKEYPRKIVKIILFY